MQVLAAHTHTQTYTQTYWHTELDRQTDRHTHTTTYQTCFTLTTTVTITATATTTTTTSFCLTGQFFKKSLQVRPDPHVLKRRIFENWWYQIVYRPNAPYVTQRIVSKHLISRLMMLFDCSNIQLCNCLHLEQYCQIFI